MNAIPINIENANSEIWARIIKAEARKYDFNVNIDFSNGNRKVEFVGDQGCVPYIVEDIQKLLYGYAK